ncbi:MAG: prepilin-type N-terminal cleavage/methylation domain-containing protein [Gemmatimonadaceae bacterium]|nr:prepilin-type N-terminal cleavage/methylation domain-containing protein [Gemmatimonadaceae bacterium]
MFVIYHDSRVRSRAGFTFFELMIVITIVGILSAVSVPRIQRSVRLSRLQNAQSALIGEISSAASAASRRRRPVVVQWDAALGEIQTRLTGSLGTGVFIARRAMGPDTEYGLTAVAVSNSGAPVDSVVFVPSSLSTAACFALRVGTGRDTAVRRVTVNRAGVPRALAPAAGCP